MSELKSTATADALEVSIRLLENDCVLRIQVPVTANGKWLLREVCKQQEVLAEIEYFGLRYISKEMFSPPSKHWMNPTKSVRSQLKHSNPRVLSFRIKHYPSDPFTDFNFDKSKYLLFHQLHRDFLSGRLIAPHDDLIRLAALFIQVALGDASEITASASDFQSHEALSKDGSLTYLSNFRSLHNTSKKRELEILEEHRKLEGLLPSEAAAEVIRIALRQPSYGVEPFKVHSAKHKNIHPMHIGLTHEGVAEFRRSKRAHLYKWAEVDQFFYSGRSFIIRYQKALTHGTSEYKCESRAIASELWSWALERMLFFTLEKSPVPKAITTKYNLFSRRHTFNFVGRCRSQLIALNPAPESVSNSQRISTPHLLPDASIQDSHHQMYQTCMNAAPPSAASKFPNECSINNAISTSSTFQSALQEDESTFGEYSSSLEVSEQASISTPDQPTFVRLAPYFESISSRKYNSLSRIRQMRCVTLANDSTTRGQHIYGSHLNRVQGQPVLDNLGLPEFEKQSLDSSTPTSPPIGSDGEITEKTTEISSIPRRTISSLCRRVLITGSISLIAVILGISLISDFGVEGRLQLKIRSSSFFGNW